MSGYIPQNLQCHSLSPLKKSWEDTDTLILGNYYENRV
jgi:hypothetical protein